MRARRRLAAALAATVVGLSGVPAPVAVAASDFPAGWEGFHTYAEMSAEIEAVAAAHPDIVRRFSIGQSHEGRELWAAKVSDNVAIDEPEPEVLYDGLHHGDEHMSVEMTLAILGWLVEGYGSDPRVTGIVDEREIWIVFSVNPDGAEHDIATGSFRHSRKNRQPTPGSRYVGTDLNRNYDYRWTAVAGRTSTNPQAITYRGPAAFSAPETRAIRDFLASRVIDGVQQIRTYATFHEFGRLVMWPYGYTLRDVPGDMTAQDRDALRRIGVAMAATNGYRPMQASDLYLTSGSSRDYAYGRYRIFGYTFELSARDYPGSAAIASETSRNREAVLILAERAWCPYTVLGAEVRALRCGAFDDDLEVGRGWRVNRGGTDTATAGQWRQGNPSGTSSLGLKQLDVVPSGRYAFATGLPAGARASTHDVDGGVTTVESRPFSLPAAAGQRLVFRWSFAHSSAATSADEFRVDVVPEGGAAATVFVVRGRAADRDAAWRTASLAMDNWAGQVVRLRFSARDGGRDALVEAAFDDVRITRPG